MEVVRSKTFANGIVYALKTNDGYPIEVTDTFLPFYTKDAINQNKNSLKDYCLGSRSERWMIGVSCMSGCPVGCKFCATAKLKKVRNLSWVEILEQVGMILLNNKDIDPSKSKEFKINYTRMGEPFLNLEAIKKAIHFIDEKHFYTHHYISTIGIKDSDFSWIKGNITLQISLHSLNEDRRNALIPFKRKMTIKELGQIRTQSNLKTTINMTMIDEADWDIDLLKEYFDPKYFFIKLSPINPNSISEKNDMGSGLIQAQNLV